MTRSLILPFLVVVNRFLYIILLEVASDLSRFVN